MHFNRSWIQFVKMKKRLLLYICWVASRRKWSRHHGWKILSLNDTLMRTRTLIYQQNSMELSRLTSVDAIYNFLGSSFFFVIQAKMCKMIAKWTRQTFRWSMNIKTIVILWSFSRTKLFFRINWLNLKWFLWWSCYTQLVEGVSRENDKVVKNEEI